MQRALVERAQDGDLPAFTELVKTVAPRMHGIANLILRDSYRAQDVVQDALLAAWRDLRGLRDPDAFEAWLRRLTVRACYKAAKRQSRQRQVELQVPLDTGRSSTPDASALVADRDWILKSLAAVPMDQRVVIALHYYYDLPIKEVANTLELPYGTAASRLHRGLEAMRTNMREHDPTLTDPAQESPA